LAHWGLSRGLLSCNFLSRSFFFALGGLFVELPSDGPQPLFPSCLLLFGRDTRGLLVHWGLSRGVLSCNFLSRSFFFALGSLFVELPSDGPKPLLPSCLLLFSLDTRGLLAHCSLSRGLLSCNFLSCGFLALGLLSRGLDTGRLLTSCFLPLRLQLGGCLPRSFLALGLLSPGLDTGRLLTSCFLPLRLQLRGCLPRGLDLVGGLQVGDGQFNDRSGRRVGGPFGARERSRSVRTGPRVFRWLGFCRWPGRWNDF
jgi:hypothetical protein